MFILKLLATLIIVYLLILLIIFLSQRKLLYHPSENNYLEENLLSHKVEKIKISSNNSINLESWYFLKNSNFKTLVFFHGNAGSLENRIHKLNHLSNLDINYLIFAYRGFSGNKGMPTEKGIYEDANAVIYWLNSKGVMRDNIILYGESLGAAVAIEIAKNKNFAGIILESPFTSMEEIAKIYYPYIPVRLLLKDKYKTNEKISNVNSPILVMHGKKDQIVPFDMGKKIFNLAKNPKYNFFVDYDDHMMEYNENLLNTLKKFIQSLN